MTRRHICPVCDEPMVGGACPTRAACTARLAWEHDDTPDPRDADDTPAESEDDA